MVIAPGGGYVGVADDVEGMPYARWLCSQGIASYVLNYRCGGQGYVTYIAVDRIHINMMYVCIHTYTPHTNIHKIGTSPQSRRRTRSGRSASCAAATTRKR